MGAGVIGTYLGVVAVVLRSWCVVMCTVCQLVSNWRGFFFPSIVFFRSASALYLLSVSLFLFLIMYGSSGQSFWLQIQRSRVRFPALSDFSE